MAEWPPQQSALIGREDTTSSTGGYDTVNEFSVLAGFLHGYDEPLQDRCHMRLGIDKVKVVLESFCHLFVIIFEDPAETS